MLLRVILVSLQFGTIIIRQKKKELYVRLRYAAREFASLIAEFCRLRTSRQRVCPLPLKVYTVCLASRRANSRNSRNSRNKIRFRSARRRSFFSAYCLFILSFPATRVHLTLDSLISSYDRTIVN